MSEGDTSSVPDSKFAEPPPLSVKERAAQMSAKDGGQRSVSPPAYTKLSGDRLCKQRTLPSVSTCKAPTNTKVSSQGTCCANAGAGECKFCADILYSKAQCELGAKRTE